MSLSSEHIHADALEHAAHEVDPHFLVARARAGVLLLILSDALAALGLIAGGGYLGALNTLGQYKIAGDHASSPLQALLLAVALAVSGFSYFWWQLARKRQGANLLAIFALAWVCMIAATVIQIVIGSSLGYTAPYHAYESLIILITWYSAIHLLLTSCITGLLVFGRGLRGRLVDREYIVEVHGYWWYYTVIVSLIMLLFTVFA